jgi:thiol-disulfide isomerase/thioredoxin
MKLYKWIKKLFLIDFWASWCAPCREAMPSSKKLKEEFKNKEITRCALIIE